MTRLFVIALAVAGGCSAAGVPIFEPEHVTAVATAIPRSQLEAIAWSIRDVVGLAVKDLLRAAPGAVDEQLTSGGTITIHGSAAQPADTAEALTVTLAYDGYEPVIHAAVPYTDWRLSSSASPTLTIDFSDEPIATNDLGSIDGAFEGVVHLVLQQSSDAGDDVDTRLAMHGQLAIDATGNTVWQGLDFTGVVHSPRYDYYYNEARFPYDNKK